MQRLGKSIINSVGKAKMIKLEKEIREEVYSKQQGEMFECPFCHYIAKNKRFTAKIFDNNGKKSFKCFNCGKWRRL